MQVTVASPGFGHRTLAAVLVDFSEIGLGLEMFVPLRVGSLVDLHGNLRSDTFALRVDGTGRVVHSSRLPGGNYQIGLALQDMAYRKSA